MTKYYPTALFDIGATVLSGSRGPLAGAIAMATTGTAFLLVWFWHNRVLRLGRRHCQVRLQPVVSSARITE